VGIGYWLTEDNPWLPDCSIRDVGGEVRFSFVGRRSAHFENKTAPTIVRPFFDVNDRMQSAVIVAAPGLATGVIAATAKVDVWGAEANFWKNVYYDYPGTTATVDLMAGFRYLDADHSLQIASTSFYNQNLAAFPTFLPFAGNRIDVFDSFVTHNHFYGGQVGIAGKCWVDDKMSLEGVFKLGLGTTSEDLNIAGGQVRTFPGGATATSSGGLLALPSNMGRFHRNQFAQVPELDFNVAFPCINHVTFSTGFSALYWSRLLRPGQQIDRAIDITQIPNFPPAAGAAPAGLASPGVPFRQGDLWLLGINLGMEVYW
jgi:hypothetical protein